LPGIEHDEGLTRREFLRRMAAGAAASLGAAASVGLGPRAAWGLSSPPYSRKEVRAVLSERYGGRIATMLVPVDAYEPFAAADERGPWEALPADVRSAALAAGEGLLGHQWPPLPATLYLDFARTGNRSRYEGPYFGRRTALNRLVIAECVEGKDRFRDDIVNGIWTICEESGWVIPAHDGRGRMPDIADPIIDLFSAETGALLAWVHYLLRPRLDAVDDRISARIRLEVKTRILDPFLARNDFWWMGFGSRGRLNNWSPWCSSNCLTASLLLEPDAGRRAQAVEKAIGILDRFLAGYFPDGGCDEGPSYWTVAGASLFDCLELLYSATQGAIDVYDEPLVKEIGRYIYRAQISGEYYLDFADCAAKVGIPSGLVFRYGRRIGDERMSALGASVYQQEGSAGLLWGSLLRVLPDLFDTKGIDAPARPPYVRDVWLDGIQVMAARERDASDRGLYLAAKGGHNNESHNHNDVGQFMVYFDGQPVLVDAGVGTYTAQTFSDERYGIWTMQSAYHNLPTVNGAQQHEGEEFRASNVSYRADDSAAEFSLNIAGAYPESSGLTSWQRTCRLVRGRNPKVEITDDFALARPSQDVTISLMTPCPPQLGAAGAVDLPTGAGGVRLTFDAANLSASVEPIPLDDDRLRYSWGEQLFRIVLRAKAASARATWVMRIEKR